VQDTKRRRKAQKSKQKKNKKHNTHTRIWKTGNKKYIYLLLFLLGLYSLAQLEGAVGLCHARWKRRAVRQISRGRGEIEVFTRVAGILEAHLNEKPSPTIFFDRCCGRCDIACA